MGRSGRSLSCLFLSSWLHVFIVGDSSLSPRLWLRFLVDGCRHGTTVCPSESLVLLFSVNADDRRGLRYCQPFIGKLRYLRNVFSATAIAKRRFDRKSCEFSLNSSEAVGSNTIFCGHAHEGEIMVFIFNYFSFLNLKSCEKLLLLVPGFFNDFSWKMKISRFLPLLAVLWAG